ncbi:hypothetical protein L3Q82_008399, partial [Scortum barcoo]
THSDSSNERDWRREWPGQVFLSHKQSNSAGVGILFSRAFSPQSVELHHVMPGHALMVKALYEKEPMGHGGLLSAPYWIKARGSSREGPQDCSGCRDSTLWALMECTLGQTYRSQSRFDSWSGVEIAVQRIVGPTAESLESLSTMGVHGL